MANAIQVARQLIRRAAASTEPEYLCNLRLQKLLYYVQMHSLARRGRPMFQEPIEAWKYGPVVGEIYEAFKAHGKSDIPVEGVPAPEGLSLEEKDFIDSVWEQFKVYSATGLSEMTHREKPWLKARGGLGPEASCDAVITHESMIEYMSKSKPPRCEGELQLTPAEHQLILNHPSRLPDPS